jgi:predicted nucleotidyltransferase
VTGQAYGSAYQSAVDQYNKDRAYQQGALNQQLTAGGTQRDIGQQGLTSDYQQYLRELAYPQEQLTQYGTALKAAPAYSTFASNQYDVAPSMLQQIMGTSSGVLSLLNALGGSGVQTGLNTLGSGISNLLGLGGSSTTGPSIYDFGYVLKERFGQECDVDLIVDLYEDDPLEYTEKYFSLKYGLEKILGRSVDLLEERSDLNPVIKKEIERSKTLIYEG